MFAFPVSHAPPSSFNGIKPSPSDVDMFVGIYRELTRSTDSCISNTDYFSVV